MEDKTNKTNNQCIKPDPVSPISYGKTSEQKEKKEFVAVSPQALAEAVKKANKEQEKSK